MSLFHPCTRNKTFFIFALYIYKLYQKMIENFLMHLMSKNFFTAIFQIYTCTPHKYQWSYILKMFEYLQIHRKWNDLLQYLKSKHAHQMNISGGLFLKCFSTSKILENVQNIGKLFQDIFYWFDICIFLYKVLTDLHTLT